MFSGADTPNRTGDLLITNQLLYQLSYVGDTLAEEEGLEPSNTGIKIRGLNQLGDSPVKPWWSRLDSNQ